MKFTENELKIIYQYSAKNREENFILIKNRQTETDKKYLY